jgi:hypothetical protein
MQKLKKRVPFVFVLEALDVLHPVTNMMFGCTAVYVEEKIVLILRDRADSPEDNGVWLATSSEHHHSLKRDFPAMRSIKIFGPGQTGWQVLGADAEDFEESVFKACDFIIRGDVRIGKIPKKKRK